MQPNFEENIATAVPREEMRSYQNGIAASCFFYSSKVGSVPPYAILILNNIQRVPHRKASDYDDVRMG